MAIDSIYFGVMSAAMDMARRKLPNPSDVMQVGCLSYPDLLISRDQIVSRYPHLQGTKFRLREDSDKIKNWHSMHHLAEIIETSDFFDKLGCKTDYFDFEEIRGGEVIADLNQPLSSTHHDKYDVVIDTGTLEHCFNVGVAFENMCRLARVNGLIISAAPMTKINHGFWNFSPCAYDNYFSQNNFDQLFLGAFAKSENGIHQINLSNNGRQISPPESILIAIARRTSQSTFIFPTQQKYLK